MNLPENIANALSPLFAALPRQQAMDQLVPGEGDSAELVQLVEGVVGNEAISVNQPLVAALWLYIDELDRSHRVSQGIEDQTGSFWHGIMHRREGDFSNSHYWFNKVGHHPAMDLIEGYDAHQFVDAAEARHQGNPSDLVDLQRREWQTLFEWCAGR
tara:strand:- start:479 stop:949 length:471 start_codon:yes stop_codon:yes gene_type:complete